MTTTKMKLPKWLLPFIMLIAGMLLSIFFCHMKVRPFYCCSEPSRGDTVIVNNVTMTLDGCDPETPYNEINGMRIDGGNANELMAAFESKFVNPSENQAKGGMLNKCLVANLLSGLGSQKEVGYYFGFDGKNICLLMKGSQTNAAGIDANNIRSATEDWYLMTGKDGFCPINCR